MANKFIKAAVEPVESEVDSIRLEVEQLVAQLKEWSAAYYNTTESIVSDAEFDLARDRLAELDPENEYLKTVGSPPPSGEVVKHPIPMGSQDKLKTKKEFTDWASKILVVQSIDEPFVVDLKLDGATLACYYEDGKLTRAVTRGDGLMGEDITSNALKMKGIKRQLPVNFTGVLRSEVMLYIPDFEKYFKPAGYKNPRNSIGIVRDRDGSPLLKHLQPTFFSMAYMGEIPNGAPKTVAESHALMRKWGLNVVESQVIKGKKEECLEAVWKLYEEIAQKRTDGGFPFEIDGVIIKTNDLEVSETLGLDSGLRPRGERCVKFKALGGTTKLVSVELTIGHTGAIIPTGKVAPVEIGGVTITSVLLNNYEEIDRLGVAINDEVYVIRAGDVIPKIVAVVRRAPDRVPLSPPSACIACGGPIVKDGAHVFCKNEECEGKAIRRIKSWITKRDIKYLGDELLVELFEKHNIKEPQDLYSLTEDYLSKVKRGKGVVGSSSKQIMAELEKSKTCSLSDFMGSLAIKFMGRRQAEILIQGGMNTLEKFVTGTPKDFAAALGTDKPVTVLEDDNTERSIGVIYGTKATELPVGIKKARKTILALIKAGVQIVEPTEEAAPVTGAKLSGYAVCFTGVRPKPEEEASFKALGGVVKDSVSKNTTHLVVKDTSTTSSKSKKARELGVQIISYSDFQQLLS